MGGVIAALRGVSSESDLKARARQYSASDDHDAKAKPEVTFGPCPELPPDELKYRGDDFKGEALPDDRLYKQWTFYPYSFKPEELPGLLVTLFTEAGYLQAFDVPKEKIQNFVNAVVAMHKDVPYHNIYHVTDVTQAVWWLSQTKSVAEILRPEHRFALVLAASMHDLNHPGYSNVFLANDEDPLVAQFGTQGTLECFHATQAGELLMMDDTNVLCNMPEEMQAECRKIIRCCILATDMSRHKSICEKSRAIVDFTRKQAGNSPVFSVKKPEATKKYEATKNATGGHKPRKSMICLQKNGHVQVILNLMMKAADLGNVTRPRYTNERWVSRLMTEFHRQAKEEEKKEFKISPGMALTDSIPKGQVFFATVFARPLFEVLVELIPEARPLLDQLDLNAARWKKVES